MTARFPDWAHVRLPFLPPAACLALLTTLTGLAIAARACGLAPA